MDVRKDFEPVALFMERLLKLSDAFSEYNLKIWPHLKNSEDYDRIYSLPDEIRIPIEEIYSQGRDCAIFMEEKLASFNRSSKYPTLGSYIDSFENGWVYQESELRKVYDDAANAVKSLSRKPWAVN